MNPLKNLVIWYHYGEDGNIERIAKLQAVAPDTDLDELFLEKYMKPPFSGGGITAIKKEHIIVPRHIMQVEGVAFVLYLYEKRFAAVLPYYVLIEED